MVNNVFLKRKMKGRESNIDINNHPRAFTFVCIGSSKCYSISMIYYTYQ